MVIDKHTRDIGMNEQIRHVICKFLNDYFKEAREDALKTGDYEMARYFSYIYFYNKYSDKSLCEELKQILWDGGGSKESLLAVAKLLEEIEQLNIPQEDKDAFFELYEWSTHHST